MQEQEAVHRLIDKIDTGLPEIQLRSITSLHTKITIGLVDIEQLPRFKKLPGVLLTWINDNSVRNQNLYKVLTILSYFTKTEDGLVLLEQYEATQFFKELRMFLMSQTQKPDQYINILEQMIKALLPLQPQTKPIYEEQKSQNVQQQQQRTVQPKPKEQKTTKKEAPSVVKESTQGVTLSFKVVRNVLDKKQEDQLYSLFMQMRHGKRQLHLQWLKRIHDLVKYWGQKWFRFRAELVNELAELFPKSKLKWLIIEIIRSILRGVNMNSQQLQCGQSDLVNLNSSKPSYKPQVDTQKLTLSAQLFDSLYSGPLINDLLSLSLNQEQRQSALLWVTQFRFKYSPNYFLSSLQILTMGQKKPINISVLNSQIEYYSQNFPNCKPKISEIIQKIPQRWELKPQHFPCLLNFLQQAQKNNSYRYISRYDGNWCLGANLHLINQVVSNLALGVKGVNQRGKKRELIKLYVDCLLTMAVAVEKQDPLMTFYPKLQHFVLQICENNDCRKQLFQQILSTINSHSHIKYASKSFISSDLACMVFSEDNFFHKLFTQALYDQQSLACWLAITKRLILSNGLETLDRYSIILYCLHYHKNQQIKELSKYLMQKLGKGGKMKMLLCRLFSRSEQERIKLTTDLFRTNSKNVFQALKAAPAIGTEESLKKTLKIGAETILNYAKIIFGNSLQQDIKISAAEQLLQSVSRLELQQQLTNLLVRLGQNIVNVLQTTSVSDKLCSLLVQTHYMMSRRARNIPKFNLFKVVEIIQKQSQLKTIQILLTYIYRQCFQNSFSTEPEQHFTTLLYPHLQYQKLNVSETYKQKQPQSVPDNHQNLQGISLPDYKVTKQIEHACEYIIFRVINKEKVSLDEAFVGLVEEEIGEAIHASKGYVSLHYLNYLFAFVKEHQIAIPEQIIDYTAPLLTNILAKETPAIHAQPVAQLLALIGVKRTKQLNNLIANGSLGSWKLFLVDKITNVDSSILQNILKGLLGLHEGRQAALILKTLTPHLKVTEVNQFSKSLIVSCCIKFIRQDDDYMLRKIAFCCLTEIYSRCNLPADGDSELFSSVASLLTEQVFESELMVLAVNLVKKLTEQDERVLQQGSVIKLLLSKFLNLVTYRGTYDLVQAAILDLFRVIVSFGRSDLFAGADITDLALPFLSIVDRKNDLSASKVQLLVSTLDLLYFNCQMQKDLPKYLLTSTSLLSQLVTAFQNQFQDDFKIEYLQSLSRIWHKLAVREEDLFVYKLSQIVSKAGVSLIEVLAGHLQMGKQEYLKMLCWTIVIWSKNRQTVSDSLGQKIANTILRSSQPQLIKLILPFSLKAKQIFVNSSYMESAIKAATHVIENRVVKDVKQKKKKNKVFSLDSSEQEVIQNIFGMLSALFYWNGEGKVESCEAIKKGISLLEKFYLAGVWQESIMKYFLRVTTNMALTAPLSDSIAASLAQSVNFIDQIVTSIVKCESLDANSKFALRLVSSLANIESVRSQLLRSRMIDQVSNRLIRDEQRGQLSLQYAMETVELFLTFSIYKDSNSKILVDKRLLELFIRLLQLGKLSFLQQKIVKLMANLACFKHNKPTFMSCKDLHKTILGLLQDPQISYKNLLLSLLYNLMYKNSAALKLYRIPDVIKLIRTFENEQNGRLLLEVLQGDQG